jgi:8-oxo-dGTP pyrophosphatase MutT (NUDIX family)
VYAEFLKYKVRVPVCGAIIVDESLSNVLLVRGYKKDASWSWPKGKINQDESEPDCALRELLEETGFDGSAYLKPNDYIERTIKDKRIRLYILLYVPKNTVFETRTRKEIGAIEWFPLSAVPGFGKIQDQSKKHKFYLVTAFMPRLIQFLKRESKESKKGNNKLFSGYKTDYKTESESEYIHETKISIKKIEDKRIALLAALKPKESDDDSKKKKKTKKSNVVKSTFVNVNSTPTLLKRMPVIQGNPLLNFKFDVDRILLALA